MPTTKKLSSMKSRLTIYRIGLRRAETHGDADEIAKWENSIATLEQEIDELDEQLVRLFLRRMEVTGKVGEYKLAHGMQVLDREREQRLPSPLGQRPEDRYLYLGPAGIPLEAGRSQVEWKGRAFEVQSAHLVGDSHWWALLRPRDREAT